MLKNRRQVLPWLAALPAAGGLWWAGRQESAARGEPASSLPIGMNLAGVTDYDPGYPFLNVMWGARPWLTRNVSGNGPWNTDQIDKADLDEDGYPLEVPFQAPGLPPQTVFTLLPSTLTKGTYVLRYDGEGIIEARGQTRIRRAAPGRIELDMAMQGRDMVEEIAIRRSVRGNHIRNIRVVPIQHETVDLDREPFLPEFLAFCKGWHCLRFMDLLGTNNSIDQAWARRKRTSFYTQIGSGGDLLGLFGQPLPASSQRWASGIALELCIEIANRTRTAAWICVPHMADPDYIRGMAELVRAKLDPELKVYVEYSNELWNWIFLQAQWMLRSKLASDLVVAAGGKPPWKSGRVPDRFVNGIVAPGAGEGINHPERIGALQRHCFKIWEDVFAGADRQRLVRVCAVQAHWQDASRRTLEFVMRNGGCDALAPAGYFGPNDEIYSRWEALGASLTAEQVLTDMHGVIKAEESVTRANADMARRAGVRFIIYEGGQHIQPKGQAEVPYAPALGEAQKHPRMYDLYKEHLANYARHGVDLFCAFSSVSAQGLRYGSWGHLEYYGQPPAEAPKFRALLDMNMQR
jgi:hypothetical protein